MAKIFELSKREKELIGGGDNAWDSNLKENNQFKFNCTHSDIWYTDEGPCVDNYFYICREKPEESSFWSGLGYGTLFLLGAFFSLATFVISRDMFVRNFKNKRE